MSLGYVAGEQCDDAVASGAFDESAAAFRRLGADYELSAVLEGLGLLAYRRGEPQVALAAFEETLAVRREEGEPWNTAEALNLLGELARRQGDLDQATIRFQESLALYRTVDDRAGLALVLHHLGDVAHERVQPERAARLFGAAQAVREAAQLASLTTPWSLFEEAEIQRDIAAVRAVLGQAAFEAARAAGRSLALKDAIVEAQRV